MRHMMSVHRPKTLIYPHHGLFRAVHSAIPKWTILCYGLQKSDESPYVESVLQNQRILSGGDGVGNEYRTERVSDVQRTNVLLYSIIRLSC